MPFFHSNSGEHACEIHYEVKGECADAKRESSEQCSTSYPSRPDVVLIMGFGATHHCWEPQLEELLRAKGAAGAPKARVLMMDNRGVGRSGSPQSKQAYSTTVMATDVLCLMDHLGWGRVHVVGHSMGSMIATKLAVLAPHRVHSLVLISPTSGGWEALPRTWACFKITLQILVARTARQRAWLDLQLHFNKRMLNSVDNRYGRTREELLHEDYLEGAEGGGPGQSPHGFWGQIHAVMSHRLSKKEVALIKDSNIPVMVIHGRHDILALPRYGEKLARRLEAPCILLEGAHMLCRERGPEVNLLLHHHIFHGRRLKDTQHKYLIGDPDEPADVSPKRTSASQTPETSPSHSTSSAGSDTGAVERRAWQSRDQPRGPELELA